MDVEEGVRRLQEILPLTARQAKLSPGRRILHRAILGGFAGTGAPLGADACQVVLGGQDLRRALAHLAAEDLIVLADDGAIQGAYPFTTEKTPHRVTLKGHTVNAMCALDALAVAPLFDTEAVVESVCHLTGTPLRVEQSGGELVSARPSHTIRVGVQWGAIRAAAAHSLWRKMVFLRDGETATRWAAEESGCRDVFVLSDAIQFAARYFRPLLNP